MIGACAVKILTLNARLTEKEVSIEKIDNFVEPLVRAAAKKGKIELTISKQGMEECPDLFKGAHDNVIRSELRKRYEDFGYTVRFNRDDRFKLTDLTLNWG